jgi:hypothetical protein
MQELGDRLTVVFCPEGRVSGAVFFGVWLPLWTLGGCAAILHLPESSPGEVAFLLFWLCGWLFGECAAVFALAWLFFGRQLLVVNPESLEVRWEIRDYARSKLYGAASVKSVSAERVPDEDGPRADFGLRITFAGGSEHVGEGMDELEADHIAATIRSRFRPQRWWSDEDAFEHLGASEPAGAAVTTLSAGGYRFAEPSPKKLALTFAGVAACVTLAGTLVAASFDDERSRPTARHPAPSVPVVPARDEFAIKRAYASATTAQALNSAGLIPVGLPRCTGLAQWTRWTCRVRAVPRAGSSNGRIRTYACRATATRPVRCRGVTARRP